MIHGNNKPADFSGTFIHVCAYYFLEMGRQKIKDIPNNDKNNSQIHFFHRILRRDICYTDLARGRRFMKDTYIVLTTERSPDN